MITSISTSNAGLAQSGRPINARYPGKVKKILLINPSKWGRGITPIWVASHLAVLKNAGYEVELFDATFFKNWSVNELDFNTQNGQYLPTNYMSFVKFDNESVYQALQRKVDIFSPDIIFWSAISSHIHGEGEYVNIQYGYELVRDLNTKAIFVTGGLQATAVPQKLLNVFGKIDILIRGYSEITLLEVIENLSFSRAMQAIDNIAFISEGKVVVTPSSSNFSFSKIPAYDYSIFEDQVFWRPYNGSIVRAIDYEMSRGCIYSCAYCVETVIQNYYGFRESTESGAIKGAARYVRTKTAARIFEEMKLAHERLGVTLFRCQDTNFLTMDRGVLAELAALLESSSIDVSLYVETRPEGINESSIRLLKQLRVDGVGMGVEVSSEKFRFDNLKRFASTDKIIRAFDALKAAGIKRTAYNIIGLPGDDEKSILETIEFNRRLDPDNITVAYYSPYIGTEQQRKSNELGVFDEYELHIDGQLRTLSRNVKMDVSLLNFYKRNFSKLVREGVDILPSLKNEEMF